MEEKSQKADEGGLSLESTFSFKEGTILIDKDLAPCIINIVEKTEKYCFIVTPYVDSFKNWQHFERRLNKAYNDKKMIVFIFKEFIENSQNPREKENQEKIEEIKNEFKDKFDFFLVDFLHSKIYLNEKQVLITSFNLKTYAKDNNHEIGCLINDPAVSEWIVNNVILKTILEKQDAERIKTKLNEVLK
jgi:phosphatidylserine/phosphatidylglycerophosphate/cardiolipin synthase-like enzyme